MDDPELEAALAAVRTSFTGFQDQQDAAIRSLDRLLTEHRFVLEILHLPKADPSEDFEEDGNPDGMLAACHRGEYACYRVTLHNEVIVLDEMCSWSKPGMADGQYPAYSLPDTMALDVADDFVEALERHAEK